MVKIIFWSLCCASVVVMMIYYATRLKRLKTVIYGVATGIISLLLINYFGEMIGTSLPLNLFNVSGSIILGVPFVICMVIFNFL
ncbi:MAG: pro-sigmaK processing inhibitor BofA family protein [Ruminococcus sp.]|nr:pro-sigmaK processing inhibitor BofA family protein [Ruminococcus sp.]